MEREQKDIEARSLLEFLLIARSQKHEALSRVSSELAMLERDIGRVKQRLERGDSSNEPVIALQTALNEGEPEVPVIQEEFLHSAKRALIENDDDDDNDDDGGNSRRAEPTTMLHLQEQVNTAASDAKAILQEHFVDLQACYFDESADDPLDSFGEKIAKLTKLTRIRQVSALKLGDIAGSSNIISSIEFDRDSQIFATAGVSKKIRFYEFRDAMNSYLDLHCPVREISCKSKVSCISWNPYVQQQIASADYEGLITVYDANTSTVVCHLEEHEKRSWSVDFSSTDPTRLASGSDDCYVKLWSLKSKKSICTIDDHNVHLYDLRSVSRPLDVFKGHKKAVSYVRFADNSTVVSASTDCTLRQWELPGQEGGGNLLLPTATGRLARTFSGHLNEKNFVGLTVQGELYACGSENNAVYVYHRDLSKPLTTYRFSSACPLTESTLENETQQFVSSLCWKRDSNLLVAANSQGNIRILEVV